MAKQSSKEKKARMKILVPRARLSFPVLWTPKAYKDQKEKFSATLLLPKKKELMVVNLATKEKLELAKVIGRVKRAMWGPDKEEWPGSIKSPIRDGDEKQHIDGYKGHYFIKGVSYQRPSVLNAQKEKIKDPNTTEIYAGCMVAAVLTAHAYDNKEFGNRGVSFWLNSIMKVGEGEPFGGNGFNEEDFEDVEADEEAEDSDEDDEEEEESEEDDEDEDSSW